MFDELVIGETSSLREAVHSLADFEEHALVDDKRGEVIGGDNAFGEKADRDPHVFFTGHCGIEIKILCIGTHPSGIGRRDGAVDQEFEGGELGARCGSDTGVIDEIAADGPSHSVRVSSLAAISDDGPKVDGGASSGQQGWMDEFASVGAFYFRPTDSAVGEATNFFDVGLDVQFGVGSFDEVAIFEGLAGGRVDDGVDKVIAMGIAGAFEDGVIAGWEALGGFIACFVAGGMVMAARASWEGWWSRRLWKTSWFWGWFVEIRDSFWGR